MEYGRIRDFIISYTHDDEGLLAEIYEKAVNDEVPIIRRETRDYLKVLLGVIKPKQVLEIGTAVGYSTLVIAETLSKINDEEEWHIDTCELDQIRIAEAKSNFSKSLKSDNISLFEGDAAEMLKGFDKSYDFIFIDAAKAQYMIYLEESIRLSHKGTVILTDNIFAEGDVLESHFLVEKRDRTIHDRMREYLQKVMNDSRLETSILSVGDGLTISVVK